MQRAARKLITPFLLNQSFRTPSTINRLLHSQVNLHYSKSSPFPFSSSLFQTHYGICFFLPYMRNNGHNSIQNLHFSSEPSMGQDHLLLTELVSENQWSQEFENELESKNFSLSHETVLYVLKKLEKKPRKAIDFFDWVSDKKGIKLSPVAFNLMLRILGRKELMKEFWVFAKEMRDEGHDIEKETYLTLLSRFANLTMSREAEALTKFVASIAEKNAVDGGVGSAIELINGSDWNEEIETKLGAIELSLSDVVLTKILRETRAYPLRALAFFRWAGEKLDYKHNAVTYNAIVRILGREDCIREFWSMVEEMKGEGFEMDIDTYIKVSRGLQKRRMMKEAVDLYELMMASPYKPSVQDCTLLLRNIASSSNPDIGLVFRVVKFFEEAGNCLSKAIYDGIHRSLTSNGRFDEAGRILDVMKDAGFVPDNITYSQLVFGLCKAGRLDEACKILDEMEASGCVPDIKTWTILIQGHFQAGEVDKALSCFAKMLEKKCDPDSDLLQVLVSGLCAGNKVDAAYTLVLHMAEKARLRPWQATYKQLIESLLGEGKLEEALKLLNLMKKHNFPPFGDPFVRYVSKVGTVEDAMDFLRTLTVKRYPSSSAYLYVFKSFFQEGRYSEAQDLLYKSPHHIRSHCDVLNLFASKKPSSAT